MDVGVHPAAFEHHRADGSYGQVGVRDRWCGALEDPDEACGGEAQCPSWENVFPMERNTWGNLESGDPVRVLDIPEGHFAVPRLTPAVAGHKPGGLHRGV